MMFHRRRRALVHVVDLDAGGELSWATRDGELLGRRGLAPPPGDRVHVTVGEGARVAKRGGVDVYRGIFWQRTSAS